jgi:hypothetical protein
MDALTSTPHPSSPPGVRVLAHARAGERQTWATNAFKAWYVGPALDHYRCFTVWATKSRRTRIVNQVVWFPPKAFPTLNSEELLRATIEDLKVILMNPPTETYVGNMEQTQRGQLINFQELLHQTVKPTDATILGVPLKEPKLHKWQGTNGKEQLSQHLPSKDPAHQL